MRSGTAGQTGSYHVLAISILLMVGGLLAWQAWSRTNNFESFHRQLADATVSAAAKEIELLVSELHRSMRLFARERERLLEDIATAPDNEALWVQLETAVVEHFPEMFGMTLTNNSGNTLRPDFENRVGEVCEQDIHAFITRGYRDQGVIHPNPVGYHFDIMAPWGRDGAPQGVFFLSFQPLMIARILQHLQPPGHELILLNRDRKGLIEMTATGTRETLPREPFLSEDDLQRYISSVAIADSHWDLIDLPEPGLFYRETVRNWIYAGTVFGVLSVVTLLMIYQLRRKERSRQQAEQRALLHQEELAHVDRLNILGEMASGLAHELNQPLSAISTYCQSGLRIIEKFHPKPEKLVHILESSSRQAKRAGEIIHRMRSFASKGKSRPAQTDINRVIKEAADFIRPGLQKNGISLLLDLTQGLPRIMADSIQIEQVIMNLMRNAIEAMVGEDSGPHMLTVSSHLTGDGQVQVRVCDTGHGLQPDSESRVFETFYSTKSGGMGLGLAISRSIIEAHGGQLNTETVDGPGACFWFSIPIDKNLT